MTSFNQANVINIWFRSAHGKNILIFDTDMTLKQFNVFRRILLSEIPIIAVDLIHVIYNDTVLVDEVLSNRLGVIPVMISNQNSIVRKDLCNCQSFCEKCSFVIDFKSKEFDEKSWLMSNDISPFLLKDIPIITVLPGQKISFKLLCSKSISKEHSRWSPGIVCRFTSLAETPDIFRITLFNTGPSEFLHILTQAFSLMKIRLGVDINIC